MLKLFRRRLLSQSRVRDSIVDFTRKYPDKACCGQRTRSNTLFTQGWKGRTGPQRTFQHRQDIWRRIPTSNAVVGILSCTSWNLVCRSWCVAGSCRSRLKSQLPKNPTRNRLALPTSHRSRWANYRSRWRAIGAPGRHRLLLQIFSPAPH